MATALLAASEATVTLTAVRLEAENGRPIVRAVVSGPTPARVERSGRDLLLVLPGAHPRPGLLLPFPNAGIAELTLKDGREGVRIRIRLDKPLDYELRQEPGLMSVTIVPWGPVHDLNAKVLWPAAGGQPEEAAPVAKGAAPPAVEREPAPAAEPAVQAEAAPAAELPVEAEAAPPAPPPVQHEATPAAPPAGPREGQFGSTAGDVRDLYAKILPPPAGVGPEGEPPAEGSAAEPAAPREGFYFGPVRLRPTLVTSYIDADTALLDTPQPVRDRYFQIEPRLTFDLGAAVPGGRKVELTYNPRFRTSTAFPELRHATHLATLSLETPVGARFTVRALHHYARGVIETTEVDPGREYFFRLTPFTRQQTTAGVEVNSGGRFGLDVHGSRDSVHLRDNAGFFDHRTDVVSSSLIYELGPTLRAYLRYAWDHVPPSAQRQIIESRASTVSLQVNGELIPLVRGDLMVGYRHLSAPRGGSGGTQFDGTVLAASLRKEFTPSASLSLVGSRNTYPSGFEENAFYVATSAGLEADLGLPLSLVFHGTVGWQRNGYRVPAAGLSVPRRDDLIGWSAGVGRSLTRWSFLRGDYRQDRRDSNLPAFDTNGHVFIVQLGLGYLGPAPVGGAPR
ncbi:MAG TPA: outer membrane beta-barrel protein [Vicinamibacteria bacterium]|nr:outer membrane beta-barrel protein [Vicinamibacteria bacterium]